MNYILSIVKKMCCNKTLLFVFISLICNSILGQRYIFVSKTELKLSVIQNSDTIFQCPIAVGKTMEIR